MNWLDILLSLLNLTPGDDPSGPWPFDHKENDNGNS